MDFLNSKPLLPWPDDKARFKRVILAERYGIAGGPQHGIDIRATMEDGSTLAVQCKDRPGFHSKDAKVAMDLAASKYPADSYLLVITSDDVSAGIQKDADRRGNWLVVGLETLSSWFLSGSLLPKEEQKRLVHQHFGPAWLKELFPIWSDDLLVPTEQFFSAFKKEGSLHRHDSSLQGLPTKELAERMVEVMGGGIPRVIILTAKGGQGKSRFLKAVAEVAGKAFPDRLVRFQNDSADSGAEDYGLRGADLDRTSLFIDDAHRLENLRPKLLAEVARHPGVRMMIAARPNSLEPLKTKLLKAGFAESDWEHVELPELDFQARMKIALEILGDGQGELAARLAEQSKDCMLVCTVGAELVKSGTSSQSLMDSSDFKRRVFNRLMDSALESIGAIDSSLRKHAETCLRILAMISPAANASETKEKLANLLGVRPWEVDDLLNKLKDAGLLRSSKKRIRVIPDLLADHLVYETCYGATEWKSLVTSVIADFGGSSFAALFGNLAEAEWRARQEGKLADYLDGMWSIVRSRLLRPDDYWIHGVLNAWGKFAVFQPKRTLELCRLILDMERERVFAGKTGETHEGVRFDPLSGLLRMLPDLVSPISSSHPGYRREALDLLWETGSMTSDSAISETTLPAGWQKIVESASFRYWDTCGPQDTFNWLKDWAKTPIGIDNLGHPLGRAFLSQLAVQWFTREFSDQWMEDETSVHATRIMPVSKVESFCFEVLDWIEESVIPLGVAACWSSLGIIYSAGGKRSRRLKSRQSSNEPDDAQARLCARSLKMLKGILSRFSNPGIRLSIWQHLSERIAGNALGKFKSSYVELRQSIVRDVPFQLARLASSFAYHEWNHERLQLWEKRDDREASSEWWSNLAKQTVKELRDNAGSVESALDVVDQVNQDLQSLSTRRWTQVAFTWSQEFPGDRRVIVEDLLLHPERALLSCFGHFLETDDSSNGVLFESAILRALNHENGKVHRAALDRLSWRDVKSDDPIRSRLTEMARSSNPEIVSNLADFLIWNQYEPTPYFDPVLRELNCASLSPNSLCRLGEAVAHLVEYSKRTIDADVLGQYFDRLESTDELQQSFADHVMGIFHREFPERMFRLYLNRIRQDKSLPWDLGGWTLDELKNHPDYESMANEVFEEAIVSEGSRGYAAQKLFDASVARVRPELAADRLLQELDKIPLERVIKLTGCGNGSLVYEVPVFARRLLERIAIEPSATAAELKSNLIYCAIPHSWGSSGGEIDPEYLWAKDSATKLAEEFRSDAILYRFYRDIAKNQEELFASERRRVLDDYDDI